MLPGLSRSSPACIIVNANGGGLGTRQLPFSRQALLTVILVRKAEYYAGHQEELGACANRVPVSLSSFPTQEPGNEATPLPVFPKLR